MEDIGETRCGMTRGGVKDQRSGAPGPVDFSVAVLRELAAAVGEERISTDRRALEEVATDATALWRISRSTGASPALPLAVVRPVTTDHVAAAVDVASRYRLPIVPYGGGSGLMGGAVSLRPGLVVDLRSMRRILHISKVDQTAHVEAGVLLADLDAALEREGLMLGHDPWSLPVATVGGAISTNGVGYLAGRYGPMGDQVLGLTVVLPTAEVVRTVAVPTHSSGLRLHHFFIGAEGTMGIVTEAVLRAFPRPERRYIGGFEFPDFEDGLRAVLGILATGMPSPVVDYGERFRLDPSDATPRPEGPPALFLVIDGFREEVTARRKRVRSICLQCRGREMPARRARHFWQHRHDAAVQFLKARSAGNPSPWSHFSPTVRHEYLNVVVPASRVLEYRSRGHEIVHRYGVRVLEAGFWGRPELFSWRLVKVGDAGDDVHASMDRAVDEMLRLAQDLGGAMEQCHGVGLRWSHLMERQHGQGMLLMRRLKDALDPAGLMNPGKLGFPPSQGGVREA